MAPSDRLNRRSFLKAAGGATAAVTLAGCTGDEEQDTTTTEATEETTEETETEAGTTEEQEEDGGDGTLLTYARGSDSSSLDPQATTSGEDAKVMNQVYDRLIHFEPGESSLVAGLAEDYSLEGTTATLQLREGATFHNGDEFTADDFIATYDRFLDEDYEYFVGTENQSIYGDYLLGVVESVEKDGDYTLTMELGEEYAPFLANLAVFALAVLPQSEIESETEFSDNPVGTGPFAFEDWNTSDQQIRLSANDDYWGETPNVDEVVFTAISENTSRAQTLLSGGADIIDGIGAQSAQVIDGDDSASLEKVPGLNIGYMAFNMARVEAFRDKQVRQAISHAIDTQAIVENIYRGQATQASQPLPPGVLGRDDDIDPYEYDTEKAQSLLEEAGYGDGFEFELATMTNPRPYFASPVQTAQTVKSNLSEIGIEMSIDQQSSWDSYLTYIDEGKHDACFIGWISDNGDPDNFFSPLLHPSISTDEVPDDQDWAAADVSDDYNTGNYARWANTEFMDAVDEGKTTYEEGTREELYLEASQIAHEEAPWVFITHTEELRGVNNRIQNFTIAPISGPYLNLVSIDE
ncbi:ABC transporter substrate-binding protein [Halorussus salilacus]|uniref:ABC transporter substrate-binding protein n=1 Tax=Halorussus salilacus TaxID=2953750 RepID=UPI0020A21A2E|nr:ABC transporter substrate-binding protein [Halorussus salilacus]USZ69507.1 ABC transporter substrate-binding protein [Halorussus salilacus]